jgi:hypothetical protein
MSSQISGVSKHLSLQMQQEPPAAESSCNDFDDGARGLQWRREGGGSRSEAGGDEERAEEEEEEDEEGEDEEEEDSDIDVIELMNPRGGASEVDRDSSGLGCDSSGLGLVHSRPSLEPVRPVLGVSVEVGGQVRYPQHPLALPSHKHLILLFVSSY